MQAATDLGGSPSDGQDWAAGKLVHSPRLQSRRRLADAETHSVPHNSHYVGYRLGSSSLFYCMQHASSHKFPETRSSMDATVPKMSAAGANSETAPDGPYGFWTQFLHATVEDENPASPYVHTDVLYYQNSYTFGILGLYKVLQDFHHKQYGKCNVTRHLDHRLHALITDTRAATEVSPPASCNGWAVLYPEPMHAWCLGSAVHKTSELFLPRSCPVWS